MDFGRMGTIEYVGIMTEEEMKSMIGKNVWLDEPLGKHSEVELWFEEGEFVEKSDDQDLINKLLEIFPSRLISGFNLPEYVKEMMEYEWCEKCDMHIDDCECEEE